MWEYKILRYFHKIKEKAETKKERKKKIPEREVNGSIIPFFLVSLSLHHFHSSSIPLLRPCAISSFVPFASSFYNSYPVLPSSFLLHHHQNLLLLFLLRFLLLDLYPSRLLLLLLLFLPCGVVISLIIPWTR